MVLTGCKTYLQCVNAAHQITAMLKTHFPYDRISLLDVTIQNIVANTDLGLGPDQHIDLHRTMSGLPDNAPATMKAAWSEATDKTFSQITQNKIEQCSYWSSTRSGSRSPSS